MSLIYTLIKDVVGYLEWDEDEPKLVDWQWLEASGMRQESADQGIELKWCSPEKLESRLLSGNEIIFEVDKVKRSRRRIVLKDGLVLIGKK